MERSSDKRSEKPRPLVIGLTGTIAAGKSVVAKMLAELGCQIIDADLVARELIGPGQPAYQAVVADFGPDLLSSDGTIDRRKLGAIVFDDPAQLAKLDQLVHPHVNEQLQQLIAESDAPVLVIEAIKLIEAGGAKYCDIVWVVIASRDQQIARLMAARGFSEEEAARRLDAQGPPEAKTRHADVVIDNSGDFDATRRQVETAMNELIKRRPDYCLYIRRLYSR